MSETAPKSVLVTGAGRRIGRAIALDLAAAGWAVAIHYNRSRDDAEAVAGEITGGDGTAVALGADLAQEEEAERLIAKAAAGIGALTCLVNNASVFEEDTPATATRESWGRHMQVNVHAPFVLTQAFARQLPTDVEGNVVNLIDQVVWNVTPYFTSYTVSKMALWGLTQTLALALAPGIRVNAIGPGPTLPSIHQTEEAFERQWSSLPLRRRTMPEEICRAVRFLLDAPSITGQMIVLDGGQHLGWRPGPGDRPSAG
ncbi:MAG: SDR family oxidoreductase [Rhodospirillales bacterium]